MVKFLDDLGCCRKEFIYDYKVHAFSHGSEIEEMEKPDTLER